MKTKILFTAMIALILSFGFSTANASPVKPPFKHRAEMKYNNNKEKKHHHHCHHGKHHKVKHVK